MRLSIIEIDYHSEVLRNLCLLVRDSEFILNVFTTERIWSRVNLSSQQISDNINIYLKPKNVGIRSFFNANKDEINNCDIIVFNTIASYFRFFLYFDFQRPLVVRVHNANAFFQPWKSWAPGRSRDEIQYDIGHIIWKSMGQLDWFYRQKFLKKVSGFLFPGQNVIDYVRKIGVLHDSKIVDFPLPNTFVQSTEEGTLNRQGDVKISIPGTVEKKRRNYDLVVGAFRKINSQTEKKYNLILLGQLKGSYGKRIKNELSRLGDNIRCVFFDDFISQSEYDQHIRESNFLLAPIHIDTRYQIYHEKYGLSKISGVENDIIKWGKPAVLPHEYSISLELSPLVSRYENVDDLVDLIIGWEPPTPEMVEGTLKRFQPRELQIGLKNALNSFLK